MNTDYDVVIIGTGLAGLLAGARIAKEGYKTVVLEKTCLGNGAIRLLNWFTTALLMLRK